MLAKNVMIKNWLIAFRLKTLTAAFVPIIVATSLVHFEGLSYSWSTSLWAMLSALFIQIATNLFNDAIDFTKGADTERRVGPKRVTQSGLITQKTVYIGGFVCCILAALCGVPLVIQGGYPILVLGLVSITMGYLYTGGPFPLAYKGLGDLFVILFFGLAAVCGTYFIHTGLVSTASIVAGLQVGFLSTVLIAINNLRDSKEDVKVNKLTLAVRFGLTFSRIEILCLYLFTFLLLAYWYFKGAYPAIYLSLITLPLALILTKNIWNNEPSSIYNKYLAKAALIHLLFGVLFSAGLML